MPLPVPADDLTKRRVLLAQHLYRSALHKGTAPLRAYRRIMAVISLDLANETAVKAVVWSLSDKQPEELFSSAVQQADTVVARASGGAVRALPNRSGAFRVHGVRNDAQHDSRAPSGEELIECQTRTHDFLAAVALQVWGISFDTLAASEGINNDRAREIMSEAEALLSAGKHLEAARRASVALDHAVMLGLEQRWEHRRTSRRLADDFNNEPLVRSLAEKVQLEIDQLRTEIQQLALGLDDTSQVRLRRLSGFRWTSLMGVDDWHDPEDAIDERTAEWSVAYCTDTVIELEDRLGGLEVPDWAK